MSRTIVYADVNIILDFQKHIKMLQWFAKNNKRYLPKGGNNHAKVQSCSLNKKWELARMCMEMKVL